MRRPLIAVGVALAVAGGVALGLLLPSSDTPDQMEEYRICMDRVDQQMATGVSFTHEQILDAC